MSPPVFSAQAQAKGELRLFAVGLLLGVSFVGSMLFVFHGMIQALLAFIWVATRVEYALVGAFVIDLVLQERAPDRPRYLPATGFACGFVLPVVLAALRYYF
jgi:hypothetical protein